MTGLLGGAFDPPHLGHLALADTARRRFELDRLVVVVTGSPPHKAVETEAELRYRLAEAAFVGRDWAEVSRWELDRPGPSYTVETARWAEKEYGEAIFLVGADEFASFLTWREPREILRHVRLGVATRPGFPPSALETVLRELEQPDRVEHFEMADWPGSSTEIRALVARDEPIEGLVPPGVAELIAELRLYRCC